MRGFIRFLGFRDVYSCIEVSKQPSLGLFSRKQPRTMRISGDARSLDCSTYGVIYWGYYILINGESNGKENGK